jgi:hypothetical protein
MSTNADISEALNNTAPKIYYSTVPTLLVSIDGEPILDKINGSDLYSYVVNTSSFIVQSSSDQQFYLTTGGYWYISSKAVGPWKSIDTPPAFIQELANNAQKANGSAVSSPAGDSSTPPKLIVTNEPAELIQTDGEAELVPGYNTLFVVSNSKDEIIYDTDSGYYFILISGRWYKTKALESGTWVFNEPGQLPVIFQTIPPTSKLANVLLSVPGTPESIAAALNNAIPQTAVVDRNKATMMIEYDGEPQFADIEGTKMKYGVNTGGSIVQDSAGVYYAVDQAVWFTGNSPKGPWKVAINRPSGINEIPPNCPVFNIKFVYIYDYTPDVVFMGYTPGYTGSFLYHGVVVYGTGYRYKPWHGSMFIPGPYTFGYGAQKQSAKNNVNVWVTYGYGGFYNTYYNPVFFVGAANTPDIQRQAIDPNNLYKNRSVGIIKTETAQRNDPMNPVLPAPSNSQATPNLLYTDANGNIFSQDEQGNWYQRQGNDWQPSGNPVK